MMKKNIWLLLFGLLLLPACNSETYQPGQLPDDQLRFGSGGGFAGAYNEYVLLENGQLFHRSKVEGALQPKGKISKRKARRLFEAARATDTGERSAFNHPGNLYYFLEWKDAGGATRWTWGDGDYPVKEEVASLYGRLRELSEN